MELRYLYHFPSKNNIKQNGNFQCQKINLLKAKKEKGKRMLNVSEGFTKTTEGMREEKHIATENNIPHSISTFQYFSSSFQRKKQNSC